MATGKIISDEVLLKIQAAASNSEHWMAYSGSLYSLEPSDAYFFTTKVEAQEFCENNISDYDRFNIRYVQSAQHLLSELSNENVLENDYLSTNKSNVMNEQNFEYLKDNIKYMGFGEKLNTELENQLRTGDAEFQLSAATQVNKKQFEAKLQFRKSDNSDMYFFNSYNASLQRKNGELVSQTFYLNKGKGITAKEAYNLLEGRAVCKELSTKDGQTYKAWVQLNFDKKDKHNNHEVKQFHENYGFDLKAAVSKFAVLEMNDDEKANALMHSLQKGNIQSVSIEKDGNISKVFIEANPQYKTVTLYDGQMKRMQKEELSQYHSVQQSQQKEIKQDQKQEIKHDAKRTVNQNQGEDLGGLKTKSSRKKGMSI